MLQEWSIHPAMTWQKSGIFDNILNKGNSVCKTAFENNLCCIFYQVWYHMYRFLCNLGFLSILGQVKIESNCY